MQTIKRVHRKLGPLRWSRDEWVLLLVEVHGRAFGVFWGRVARELVLIAGCKVIDRTALGAARTFTGGLHLRLGIEMPFVDLRPPPIIRFRLHRSPK